MSRVKHSEPGLPMVKLGILADSRSFLANQKARNAIVGAENLLNFNIRLASA